MDPDKVKGGSRKRKIDHVLQGTGTLSVDGTSNEEEEVVQEPAKMIRQLGFSFESGISEMSSGTAPTLLLKPSPPVAAMNPVAVKAAPRSNRQTAAATTKKKSSTSKKAVGLCKDDNKEIPVTNDKTRQTTLTQLQYPSPPEEVSAISTVQHLFEANRFPERTIEEFYTSKKSHRGAVVQYAGQLEALTALLQDIQNNWKLRVKPDRTLWLEDLKKDKPPATKLAFWILCFTSLMGKISDSALRKYVVPVLMGKTFQ